MINIFITIVKVDIYVCLFKSFFSTYMFYNIFEGEIRIMENKNILDIKEIKEKVSLVFKKYPIKSCILFGSYARGEATKDSDVDLVIDRGALKGLSFFGMAASVQEALGKEVDILTVYQVSQDQKLLANVLKDGVRIYG